MWNEEWNMYCDVRDYSQGWKMSCKSHSPKDITGKFCNRVAMLMLSEILRMETCPFFYNEREYKRLCFHYERYEKRTDLHYD